MSHFGKGDSHTGSKCTSTLQHAACFLFVTLDDYTLKTITSFKCIIFTFNGHLVQYQYT